uniref:Uncharacterized protein n=1 Tax=Anopheles atroparvus TaxID=41427 RepID=A0A182J8J1_ANOAO
MKVSVVLYPPSMPSMANYYIPKQHHPPGADSGGRLWWSQSGGTSFGTSSAEFTTNLSRYFPHHSFFSMFFNECAMGLGHVISMILFALVVIVGLFENTLVMRTCLSNWIAQSPCSIFPVPEPLSAMDAMDNQSE